MENLNIVISESQLIYISVSSESEKFYDKSLMHSAKRNPTKALNTKIVGGKEFNIV